MRFLLFTLLLGLAAAQNCPPPPECPPPEDCGADMMWCRQDPVPNTPTDSCPMCPGDCPPPPVCPSGHCMPSWSPSPNNPEEKCWNTCPTAPCPEGNVLCPTDYDSNGCPMPPSCAPQPMCGEPLSCPQSNDSSGCPLQPECGPEEMVCYPEPPPPSAAGPPKCPPMNTCMPSMNMGHNGQKCPASCPMSCPEGMSLCPEDYGSDGCPMTPTCMAMAEDCPRTHAPNGCMIVQQMECAEGEMSCPLGADDRGCHMGFMCSPGDMCPPPTLPTPNF